MKLFTVSILLSCFCHFHSFSQEKFVQFIIVGIGTEDQCRVLEEAIKTHPGFSSVRAESHSGNFLASFDPANNYTETDFKSWLSALGFDFYCFRTGVKGVDRILRLTPELCELMERKQNE